eukprot:g73826.t1
MEKEEEMEEEEEEEVEQQQEEGEEEEEAEKEAEELREDEVDEMDKVDEVDEMKEEKEEEEEEDEEHILPRFREVVRAPSLKDSMGEGYRRIDCWSKQGVLWVGRTPVELNKHHDHMDDSGILGKEESKLYQQYALLEQHNWPLVAIDAEDCNGACFIALRDDSHPHAILGMRADNYQLYGMQAMDYLLNSEEATHVTGNPSSFISAWWRTASWSSSTTTPCRKC